jgi:2-polyprenyl-6-hydroxyphenyl methylase/3-demethylubiquinone-9 3-methyltransferase
MQADHDGPGVRATAPTPTDTRFEFGENWQHFLSVLDEKRIIDAEDSLKDFLQVEDLASQRFLDIGCGSGLFSLAARRLGAEVLSFDYDPQSVNCTQELKARYFPDDDGWQIEAGSALDSDYMQKLGQFDVVYSWGVLHHTGAMWTGFENAIGRVATPGGRLFVAIYNDQGWKSHLWWFIKLIYNKLPRFLRTAYVLLVSAIVRVLLIVKYTVLLKPWIAVAPLLRDDSVRGMDAKYDRVDWIGGFPYEFVDFETLKDYFELRGFSVIKGKQSDSLGCHELSLQRTVCAA